MKKLFVIVISVIFITACGNSSDQGGVVDDGIGINDSDGALVDSTPGQTYNPATDTSKMEDRVDLQQRENVDTAQLKPDSGSPAHKPVLH